MAKILTLLPKEAQQLRDQLLQLYKTETAKDFTPVTYLGAYDNLRAFILSKLKDIAEAEASITVYRLRKLFYYTNPTFCSTDKLEDLSFGSDFITPLLNLTIEQNTLQNDSNIAKLGLEKSKPKRFKAVGAIIALSFITYIIFNFKFQKPYFFRDNFTSASVSDLKARGWDFIDFDSSSFFPQDTGVLTLRSSRGAYWVRPIDTPFINNVVYRELPLGDCFEVITKFTFYGNYEPWQQCGIFILDNEKNRRHYISMTCVYLGERDPDVLGRIFDRGYQIIRRDYEDVHQIEKFIFTKGDSLIFNKEGNHRFEFYFKIEYVKNKFRFYAHRGVEDQAFDQIGEMTFNFIPRYVALASFNGLRITQNGPLNTASSVPAKFDWIKIKECE